MADDFSKIFASGGFTGKYPDGGFVFSDYLRKDFSHPLSRSDTFNIPKGNGCIGIDVASGRDMTGIAIFKDGFTQTVINITRHEYAKPRTGDLMLMIADIDNVERTPASEFADREMKMMRDIAKAMSKALDDKFFKTMRGGHGNRP